MTVTGLNWTVSVVNTTSPSAIMALYTGTYPVAPGANLPPLMITGVFTSDAVPTYTNTTVVSSADDPSPSLNSSYDTVTVIPGVALTGTPRVQNTPSATETPVGTGDGTPVGTGNGTPTVGTGDGTPVGTGNGTPVGTGDGTPVGTGNGGPDLQIIKGAVKGDQYEVGDKVTFFIAITNVGKADGMSAPNTVGVSAPNTAGVSAPNNPDVTVDPGNATNPNTSGVTISSTNDTPVSTAGNASIVSKGEGVTDSATISDPSTITVQDVIPLGASHVHAYGTNWTFSISDKTSPTVIDAHYTGTDPLGPNQTLPVITITAELTDDAVPSLTDTATVDVPGDVNTDNNTAAFTVYAHGEEQNNNSDHQNNDHQNNDHQNTDHHNNNNEVNNNNNNSSNNENVQHSSEHQNHQQQHHHYPGLPLTGSDPGSSR
ncbi:hypothetical protein KDA_18490 [Dictyobacter alpinus]|uniref:DUF11 domain-containing protein n=1 Tax=Dictyobacter alpinus TaxID=2014873 RepID=A0A402B4S6_9CHLR|nr:hypothetical protein KDA_18490 [Dictyobacter alpinus]